MRERPSVREVTRGAVGRVPRRPTLPPRQPWRSRLLDRLRSGELLRLRGRFRGRRGLLAFLAVMGPGIIAGMAGNDAGGITTYTVVGAETGYTLLWVFPVMVVLLAIVQEMAARLGVVTGQGLSDLIRDRFGVRWTAFAMLVLLVANVANTVAEFAGVRAAAEVIHLPYLLVVPGAAVALWALVLFANRRTVERAFLFVIVVFGLYIVSAIQAQPDWGDVARALVTPTFNANPAVLLLMVALLGTTITPFMQFYLQSAVAEKGIDEEELALERVDAIGGAVWTNTIAVFIVVAVAATLGAAGVTVESAGQAAVALEPVAGQFASLIFAIGLFGASMLAATILPITTAFVICEAFGWESGVGKPFRDAPAFYGIFTFVLAVGALFVLIPGLDLVPLLIATQNLQGLLLPFVLVFLVLLVNDERLMGRHRNGRVANALAWGTVAIVVILDLTLLVVSALDVLGVQIS